MHELLATQAILDKALAKASEAGADRITDVRLAVGELSGFADDSVQFYWDEICKGTKASQAKLHFRHIVPELQCMACFTPYSPKDDQILCPACGSSGAKILAGEEFYLESLDVE